MWIGRWALWRTECPPWPWEGPEPRTFWCVVSFPPHLASEIFEMSTAEAYRVDFTCLRFHSEQTTELGLEHGSVWLLRPDFITPWFMTTSDRTCSFAFGAYNWKSRILLTLSRSIVEMIRRGKDQVLPLLSTRVGVSQSVFPIHP